MWWIIAGPIGGFLAGWFLKGDKRFNIVDVVVGLIGGVIGGLLFGWIVGNGLFGQVISAFLGSIVLVWVYGKTTGRSIDI
ncbi:MAG: GlsB/YeaQ/YmgE family stress response membrane protein [Ardenticatenales bacterium]